MLQLEVTLLSPTKVGKCFLANKILNCNVKRTVKFKHSAILIQNHYFISANSFPKRDSISKKSTNSEMDQNLVIIVLARNSNKVSV